MILCKNLLCENYELINDEICQWIETLNLSGECFWNPVPVGKMISQCSKFRSWMLDSALMISNAAVTYGKDPLCCGPHIDAKPARFKLNWPVKNALGTWNRWFETKHPLDGVVNDLQGISYQYKDLVEIYRHQLTGPCLIDAAVIHDVWIDDQANFPRIGLQCQLFNEPGSL